jgi:hypothetical protein
MLDPDLLNGELAFGNILLSDLNEQARALFEQVCDLDLGLLLLHFLQTHSQTFMTADDIAFLLGEAPEQVERDLTALVRLGVVEKADFSEVTLFRLTSQPPKRRIVSELAAWQDRWNIRLAKLNRLLLGLPAENLHPAQRLRELFD